MRAIHLPVWLGSVKRPRAKTFAALFALSIVSRALLITVIPLNANAILGSAQRVSLLYFGVSIVALLGSFSIPWLVHKIRRRRVFTLGCLATVAAMQDPERMNQPDLRVVTLAGSTSALFAQQALSKAKRKATRTLDEALEMIMKGTADALIADYPYCVVTAFRHKDKGLIAGKAPFTFEPMGVALPGEDVLLINWVENFLRGCQGTGLMKELQKRWFNPGPWMEELP